MANADRNRAALTEQRNASTEQRNASTEQRNASIATITTPVEYPDEQLYESIGYDFAPTEMRASRRAFVAALGAGLIIAANASALFAQEGEGASTGRPGGQNRGGGGGGGGGGRAPARLDARLHISKDGAITVMNGKVEGGQGARAQIAQAAAEELRLPPERIAVMMADTALTPDDGGTFGSRTTSATLPVVRQACATARKLLVETAAKVWNVAPDQVEVRDGAAHHTGGNGKFTYGDLATQADAEALRQPVPRDAAVTPVAQWKTLGTSLRRPNGRDIVTGTHKNPSDIIRPGMLYGKVLRAPSYGAKLVNVDLAPAQAMEGVIAVREGNFVGVAAPSTALAKQAIAAVEKTAQWETSPHPSSRELFEHFRKNAKGPLPATTAATTSESGGVRATYAIAYVQHVPMEPRAAVAEWDDAGKLTVWTATQNPFRVRTEIAGAFKVEPANVRVIVPDFGGGFGGKHTGETSVEAARLAQAAKKPVAVRWTRAEEFTWAYFRPAALLEIEAKLDASAGKIAAWHFVNVNSGRSSIDTPYRIEGARSQYVETDPPLRHGSYRALAATANNFARECFMDELAAAAKKDPLEFRLAHLENPRLRAVLEEAAKQFGWTERRGKAKQPNVGIGLACGTEKGSFVAACAEVQVDPAGGSYRVLRLCHAYECGKITSPDNLMSQVHGAIIQGLGPALREAMEFDGGKVLNASLWKYEVPRMKDLPPKLDIHLMDRPDLPPVGAGETPIICVAPAIGNAIWDAVGVRLREMPLKLGAQQIRV